VCTGDLTIIFIDYLFSFVPNRYIGDYIHSIFIINDNGVLFALDEEEQKIWLEIYRNNGGCPHSSKNWGLNFDEDIVRKTDEDFKKRYEELQKQREEAIKKAKEKKKKIENTEKNGIKDLKKEREQKKKKRPKNVLSSTGFIKSFIKSLFHF